MNHNNKKISVIMGVYNCESTLERAIESIVNQTYGNWELIMCDDGSTDSTYEIAERYRDRFPEKIIILRNDKNMHLANALNKCLQAATGEYIARMDADDESLPERFEKQIMFLELHSDYTLCGTSMLYINEISQQVTVLKNIAFPNKNTLQNHTPFYHPTIMCRRKMYEELDGYNESKTTIRCEDKDLWYRFFAAGYKGYSLQEPLYKYYENEESIYRRTPRSRWNIFITNLRGYKLLGYPWYWYYKPFVNLCKVFIPRKLLVMYKKYSNKGLTKE